VLPISGLYLAAPIDYQKSTRTAIFTHLRLSACRGWTGGKAVGTSVLALREVSLNSGTNSASRIAMIEVKWRQVRWSLQLSQPLTMTVSANGMGVE
jgi:hypothetical protein